MFVWHEPDSVFQRKKCSDKPKYVLVKSEAVIHREQAMLLEARLCALKGTVK